jgi:hypothetical protein
MVFASHQNESLAGSCLLGLGDNFSWNILKASLMPIFEDLEKVGKAEEKRQGDWLFTEGSGNPAVK